VTNGGSPVDHADVAIVGGGIVGLATGLRLLERRPQLRLVLLERESELAMHQSGHNSGVVHAGLYYAPGSVKARLCLQGKAQLETYCERKGIPIQQTGKLVIAATVDELARLDTLRNRAEANGVPGLELIGPEQIREHEPHATGLRALWSPTTGIVDFRRVALAYAEDVRALGGTIETSRPVTAVRRRGSELVLSTPHGALTARSIIVCAGLWADSVAALTGDAGPDAPRIIPFRGDYYTLTPDARPLVQGLIYPVPDPRFPFLGVHLTKRHDGEVWAGPNAVLAFKRTGYRRRDVSLRDLASILTYRGFLRLAARYYRVGAAEMWRDWSKRAFLAEIRRYVPDVRANQLMFGPSGVRAQALRPNGTLVDDFDLAGSGRVLHVRNAPSPAATSSLAIATELAQAAMERFELG
jgi:L-2-hydroxyglutarate oxidase LhgO